MPISQDAVDLLINRPFYVESSEPIPADGEISVSTWPKSAFTVPDHSKENGTCRVVYNPENESLIVVTFCSACRKWFLPGNNAHTKKGHGKYSDPEYLDPIMGDDHPNKITTSKYHQNQDWIQAIKYYRRVRHRYYVDIVDEFKTSTICHSLST